MTDFLFLACLTLAAGAAAYLGVDAIRWASRRHGRQTTTEPVSPARTTAARRLRLLLVRRPQRDRTPVHVGATEADGAFFRALGEDLAAHPGFTDEYPIVEPCADSGDPVAEHLANLDHARREFRQHIFDAQAEAGKEHQRALMAYAPDATTTGEIDRAELQALIDDWDSGAGWNRVADAMDQHGVDAVLAHPELVPGMEGARA